MSTGKIKQRHDPHMLSNVLHAESELHDGSGATGVLAMPGAGRMGAGGFGAAASSAAGALAPDAPDDVDGTPTCVMLDGWREASEVAAARAFGSDPAGACPSGSFAS